MISSLGPMMGHPKLWSLHEMLRFYAMSFTAAMSNVARAEYEIAVQDTQLGPDEPMDEGSLGIILKALGDAVSECKELPLSRVVQAEIERVTSDIKKNLLASSMLRLLGISSIGNLRNNITIDLTQHYFLMVKADRRTLLEQPSPAMGPQVASIFASANTDIAAAARCLALEEWTAAVFHLMRVLEHGLRELANRVGAEFKTSIELENWKNIIDVIEKQIRKIEEKPKSMEKTKELEFYTKAASQFWHFKEAWRNHASHSRSSYGEREAFMVFDAVKVFMQQLASQKQGEA